MNKKLTPHEKAKLETLFADAEKDTRASLNALKEYLSK